MQTREEKRETGQIAKKDNKDLLDFVTKFPKEKMERKPDWIRVKAPTSQGYLETKKCLMKKNFTRFVKRLHVQILANVGRKNMRR